MAFVWEQCKFGELVDKYEDLVETPTDGYMRLGIRSHAKGTFYSYVEKGKELETAKMFRVAANNFIVNITFGWEHAVAITDENDAGKLVSHRFPQYQFHKGMIPKFFKYLILDESFKHHLELSSPGGAGRNRVLKLNDMLNYQMRFPSEQEQKKVANYFDTLDTLITLHQRKRMLRKCFFSIDWEQRKLGDVLETIKDGTHGTHQDANEGPLLLSAKNIRNGTIIWDESDRRISINEYEKIHSKFKLKKNDVLLTIVGSIGETAILKDISGITFQRSVAFLRTSEQITPEFLCSEIQTQQFQKKLNDRKSTSAQPGIYLGDLSEIPFVYSKNKDEQVKIGQYFSNLDKLITLHQCKSNFCKKNEVNAWEQRKLGEVADIVGGGTPSTNVSNYWDGNIDWYAPAEISDQIFLSSSQRKITEKGYNNSSAKMLPIGTVLFTSRAGIGKTAILSKKGCTNQGFQSIVPHKDELDSYFIFSRTDELKRYGEIVGAGSTFVEVSGKQMANIEMMMPKTISEQKVIGAYFAKLDHLITLHQWECNINENTEGNDEKQRKPIKKLIISEGNLSLVDDMFLLHRMTFLVCNKYILLRLNVVKYKITIIIISNILYSIVSLLIIACYLIVINKQLIILIYVEISVVIIKGDDDYARIRS